MIEESEIMAFLASMPLSYLILLAILILTVKGLLPGFPFAKEVLIIYLGYRIGFFAGMLTSFVGLVFGAAIPYYLSFTGKTKLDNRNKKLLRYQTLLNEHGWKFLLILRFSPVTAQDVTSYACGFAKIIAKQYYTITATAFLFYASLYSYLGVLIT